jgi:hypothetical protein
VGKSGTPHYRKYVPSKHPSAGGRKRIPPLMWVGVAGLLLLVAGLAVLLRQPAQAAKAPQFTGGPKLAVDQAKIDFGTLPLDKPVKASFKLTNVGDQTLEIAGLPKVEVKQGC